MHQTYLAAIKTFEGFSPQAKWDYAQHSNGYGTKALYPGEAITPEEAERRFAAEIAVARDIVEKHAAGWDDGTKAALTSLTFNAGTRWISADLGDAVRSGDVEAVRERFVQYTKAQGEVLPGLLRRRLAEVDWIGSGPQAAGPEGQAAAAIKAAATQAQSVQPPAIPPAPQSHGALQQALFSSPAPAAPASEPAMASLPARSEAVAALRDQLGGLSPGTAADARSAQTLSMLVEMLFDLQMRATARDPAGQPESANPRQPQTA